MLKQMNTKEPSLPLLLPRGQGHSTISFGARFSRVPNEVPLPTFYPVVVIVVVVVDVVVVVVVVAAESNLFI